MGATLRIGRDAHVSNQLPFGSAMNRHHDVQRETRAHDLVKPLVRLAPAATVTWHGTVTMAD